MYGIPLFAIVAGLLVIAFFAPNVMQLMRYEDPALEAADMLTPESAGPHVPIWQPTRWWSLAVAVALILSITSLTQVSEFLYFQF